MVQGTCVDCGFRGVVDMHHPLTRDVDPNFVVPLCHRCHMDQHIRMQFLVYNDAARRLGLWWDGELRARRYPPQAERAAKLKESGYLPVPDGWRAAHPCCVFVSLYNLTESGWLTAEEAREVFSADVRERIVKDQELQTALDELMGQFPKVPAWATLD